MNGDENEKKSAGGTPSMNRAALRAVVGAYLIYLGVSLVRDFLNGNSTMPPWAAWGCGIFFVLAGAGVLWYAWRSFRKETQAQDKTEDAQSED